MVHDKLIRIFWFSFFICIQIVLILQTMFELSLIETFGVAFIVAMINRMHMLLAKRWLERKYGSHQNPPDHKR